MDILLLVGGLLLILIGANGLTDGAASVAKRFRIPSIVIGLTIVAFGTSAPELAVSVSSALKGSALPFFFSCKRARTPVRYRKSSASSNWSFPWVQSSNKQYYDVRISPYPCTSPDQLLSNE